MRYELSEAEKKMFLALGVDKSALGNVTIMSLYNTTATQCFIDRRKGPAVEALRRCLRALYDRLPETMRMTRSFDRLCEIATIMRHTELMILQALEHGPKTLVCCGHGERVYTSCGAETDLDGVCRGRIADDFTIEFLEKAMFIRQTDGYGHAITGIGLGRLQTLREST